VATVGRSFSGGALEGRKALVTGAGVGIGLEVARAFSEAGAAVVLHSGEHLTEAECTVREMQSRGRSAHAIGADFADAGAVQSVVDEAVRILGGLDILINNAGISVMRPLGELDLATVDRMFAVNLRATLLATQRALPALVASRRGAVINMTSVHGLQGWKGASAYAATKGGIIALTRALAIELAEFGVRVNAIAPGVIEVPRYFDDPRYSSELGLHGVPIGRVGQPADVAACALYLSSDAASFITGHVLVIDGGTTAHLWLDALSP
jgi:glucose 1-dehydrogenase/3-oxoacyl-[acyl-carrier protein] reductase